jgi:hypothetical protein
MPRPQASPLLESTISEFEELDNKVNTLTEQLSELKLQRKLVGEDTLTNILTEEQVLESGVTLSDGTEVTFERDLHCSIKKDDRTKAYEWLETHGVRHLLKREVTVVLGNDSADLAAWLVKKLEETPKLTDLPVVVTRELPGASLTAFVKKCLKAGVTLPPEFGVYAPVKIVKVPKPAPVPETVDV